AAVRDEDGSHGPDLPGQLRCVASGNRVIVADRAVPLPDVLATPGGTPAGRPTRGRGTRTVASQRTAATPMGGSRGPPPGTDGNGRRPAGDRPSPRPRRGRHRQGWPRRPCPHRG